MNKLTAITALTLLAGCSTTPIYDARFGDSVRQARLAMTINPNSAANPDQVTGIDGTAALEAIQRYHDSLKAPPPVMNVIDIGGSVGGAK